MTLRIDSSEDWKNVEQIAAMHEGLGQGDLDALEVLQTSPVPPPTTAQQLSFALTDLAKCKARIHRNEAVFAESLMWLQAGAIERAKQVLIQGWASL